MLPKVGRMESPTVKDGTQTELASDIDNRQFSKPTGEDGRKVMLCMNEHHVPLWKEALAKLPKNFDGAVLDVGCGGGGFLRMLSEKYPFSVLFGVDISEDAVAMTSEVDSDLLAEGSLELKIGSVDALPFDDASFDMLTAIETYFFWPDPEKGMEEISRVVSPGGIVMIASEIRLGGDDEEDVLGKCSEYGMKLIPDDEMLGMMDRNGFDAECFVVGPGVLYRGVKRF